MHERKPETTEAGMYPTTDVRRREPMRWKAAPTSAVPMHIATRVVAIARRESHSTYLTKGAQR